MKRRLFAGFTLFALLLAFAAVGHATDDRNKNFIDNEDGTVTQITTGLTWQKTDDGTQRNWQGAMDYCNNNTAGLPGSGWRLPNVEELRRIPPIEVFSARKGGYWSASSYAVSPSNALHVNFYSGYVYNYRKTDGHFVRCVRY